MISLGLSSFPTGKWICPDCTRGAHQCFHCKTIASDHELVRCTIPNCMRFYHWKDECCGMNTRDVYVDSFVCPSHNCAFCKMTGDSSNTLIKCFRCEKSYHHACLPRDVKRLDQSYFLCREHQTVCCYTYI